MPLPETAVASLPPLDAGPERLAHADQFALLRQRRFAPFFWTQFLGAGNDNVFKFAFTILVTYRVQVAWLPPALAGLVIGALFVLPYLLFSATSGQLADKYDKTKMIRFVKNLEIGIMLLATYAFLRNDVVVLLVCTGLMGLHSTVFGPVKFAYLPQVLAPHELTGGNGVVEMGTFVAILLGNILGGVLIALPGVGAGAVSVTCVALALTGRLTAHFIPGAPASDPGLTIHWNPATETWRNLKMAYASPVVFRSLLGISWMWFFGAVFLGMFPSFAKEVLHGDAHVASLLLVVFSIGIGAGSLLCEKLSRRHVEIGLVPLGAIGMTAFALDLYFATRGLPPADGLSLGTFLSVPAHWRVIADLALLSLSAGLYSVPMYALIQLRAPPTHRARIIAANNILNALFMILSSVIVGALLKNGATIPQIFLFVAIANAVVAASIFMLVPEFVLRCAAWTLSHALYRLEVRGEHHIPLTGAAVLVCNQVNSVDALSLLAASPRTVCYMMDSQALHLPMLGPLFRLAKAIPVLPHAAAPQDDNDAFERAARALQDGELLAIFLDSGMTGDASRAPFKDAIMPILARARQDGIDPPVVPIALTDRPGSGFNRSGPASSIATAMAQRFRHGAFRRVVLSVGTPVAASQVAPAGLRARIAALRDNA